MSDNRTFESEIDQIRRTITNPNMSPEDETETLRLILKIIFHQGGIEAMNQCRKEMKEI